MTPHIRNAFRKVNHTTLLLSVLGVLSILINMFVLSGKMPELPSPWLTLAIQLLPFVMLLMCFKRFLRLRRTLLALIDKRDQEIEAQLQRDDQP